MLWFTNVTNDCKVHQNEDCEHSLHKPYALKTITSALNMNKKLFCSLHCHFNFDFFFMCLVDPQLTYQKLVEYHN
jgi:hypothetical protein